MGVLVAGASAECSARGYGCGAAGDFCLYFNSFLHPLLSTCYEINYMLDVNDALDVRGARRGLNMIAGASDARRSSSPDASSGE